MKKAFTLVELSVVLVLAGLLLVISYKGYLIYYEAEARQEIHKINEFRLAISGYIAEKNDIPPVSAINSSIIDRDTLVRLGFLTNGTFKSHSAKTEFVLMYCNKVDNGLFSATVSYSEKVCAVLNNPEKIFVSNYEILADDSSLISGSATLSYSDAGMIFDFYKDKVGMLSADYFIFLQ